MAYSVEQFQTAVKGKNIDPHFMNVIILAGAHGEDIEKMQNKVVVVLKNKDDLPTLEKIATPDVYGVNGQHISVTVSLQLLATIAQLDCVQDIY